MTGSDLVLAVLAAWAASAAVMTLVWLVQRVRGNAAIVDVAWSALTGAIAIALAAWSDGPLWRRVLVAALAGGWSLRLAWYLARRVAGGEDPRYTALRHAWGAAAQRNMWLFYQAQALSCVVLALPFAAALSNPSPAFGVWDAAGIAVWLVAVAGEAIADAQLARFKADPARRGAICEAGLWGWSRHPNYFFEWLHWWVYVALAAGSPLFWLALAGPLAMGHFLLNVTGIPVTEQRMSETRGAAFRDYQRRVSPFIPWPPRAR